MKKIIKVGNCDECPFSQYDNEFGLEECNIKEIRLRPYEELPMDKGMMNAR